MFKASDIAKESRIIATCAAGPIIEIGFRGKHRDGCGNDLIRYVRQTVRELHPAGVMVNLSDFRYMWGDDIGALLFPLFEGQTGRLLPFCIVASGCTARSLKSLFELTKLPDLVNARYFDNARDGLAYLRNELGGDTV